MQTRIALSHPFCAGALSAVLALVWFDSAAPPEVNPARRLVQHVPRAIRFATPKSGVRIQRVDFVLDQAPPTKEDEAQKKRKAEQRRAAAAKPTPSVKAASEAGAPPGPRAAAVNPTSEAATRPTTQPIEQGSRAAASGRTPASSADAEASASMARKPVARANPQPAGAGRPPRVSKAQLLALLPGSTMLRTNTSGALRQWVNKPDGTLTVFWGGAGSLRNGAHSASGHWSITDEGRFCLQIDWDDRPENWCRYLEQTPNGEYQPIADIADANWTPPTDQTNWRPLTIRH